MPRTLPAKFAGVAGAQIKAAREIETGSDAPPAIHLVFPSARSHQAITCAAHKPAPQDSVYGGASGRVALRSARGSPPGPRVLE